MSYILDALRRADAERERGAVPGIHAQPVPPVSLDTGGRRAKWPLAWMAAGGAVVVAGVLAWQLARERSDPAPVVALAPAQPGPRPAPAGASPAPAPQAATGHEAGRPASPAEPRPQAPPPAPAPGRAAAPPPSAQTPRASPAPRPAATPVPQPVAGRREVAAAPQPARAPAAGAVAPRPAPLDVPAAAPPSPPRETRGAAAPQAGADRVVRIHELPPDVRGRLPQMSIGGSRYSTDPAKRFLIVNGQLLREKEAVTPEVTLEEIRLRGAVLRIGDWRFAISY